MSFPSRERGLKQSETNHYCAGEVSFPSRERGLKPKDKDMKNNSFKSFPSRERGLKHRDKPALTPSHYVVPLAGTWIETTVAAGETSSDGSFPSRERGLKLLILGLRI